MIPPALPSKQTFPPDGWTQHPEDPDQYYCGQEVLRTEDLRKRYALPEVVGDAPNPALVRMLEEAGVAREMPATGEFAASPELAAAMVQEDAKPVDIPVPQQWSPAAEKVSQRGATVWQQASPLGNVIVSLTEQMLFTKQAAHNREVSFPIQVGPAADPVVVQVRSISNKSLSALYRSLSNDRSAGIFGTDDTFDGGYFTTRMQILSMMLQVESCGEDFTPWDTPEKIDAMSEEELARRLSEDAGAWGNAMSAPRHALLVTAVRVFEHKFKICKEALTNGDFSDPAS